MVGAIITRAWNNGCQNSDSLVSRADRPVHHTPSRIPTVSNMLCKRECKNATMYTDSTTQNDVLDSFLILTTGIGFTTPHAPNDFPLLSGRTKIHQSPERNFSVLSSTG